MITGETTALRAITRDDLPQLLAWRNRPDYRRYFREHRELNMEQQERWFQSAIVEAANLRMFAITDRADGRLLGACGLCYIDWVNRTADFSIYVGADDLYIDEVYAPDAGRLLLGYGFGVLCLNRVWCEIYDYDLPKQKFLDGLGFSLDGVHRQTRWLGDRFHDSRFYSILAGEFTGPREPA